MDVRLDVAGDRGSIVLGWLGRLVVVLGVAGALSFDAIAVGVAHMSVPDQAGAAARAASRTWQATHDLQQSYETAVATAASENPANAVDAASFRIDTDGTVHLGLRRTAPTLLLDRLPVTSDWAVVRASGAGRQAS